MNYSRSLEVALQAAAEAADILLAECALASGPRGTSGRCPADEIAERAIRRRLTTVFPGWGYLGEETGSRRGADERSHVWLVDPNDGTKAMLQGFRGHAVSIGLLRDGVPVLGVVHAVDSPDDEGDCFAWAEGCGPLTRNGVAVEREPWPDGLGPHDVVLLSQSAAEHPLRNLAAVAPARFRAVASPAYRLALAAVGEGAAAVSLYSQGAWDYAGGHALLRAVGGALVDQKGAEVTYGRTGQRISRRCFGGAPGVVAELAPREWRALPRNGFGEAVPPPGLGPATLRPGALVHDTDVLRRAQGCWLGQLAGDSLGALIELEPRAAAPTGPNGCPPLLSAGGPHQIMAGQPTVASELALILARTLVSRGEFHPDAVAAGYARWYHGWTHEFAQCGHDWCRPFDVDPTIAGALSAVGLEHIQAGTSARVSTSAADLSSQANGALMRVSPLGIWGWRGEPDEVAQAARSDARLTHPNPVCQEASAVFAASIAQAIRFGSDPPGIHSWALSWAEANCSEASVVEAVKEAASGAPQDFKSQRSWVLIALQNAFSRLLHSPSLNEGVVDTVREGGDAGANAAICGALLGAVYGRAGVPDQWQRMILSCRPMPGYSHIKRPRPATFWPNDALTLAERLLG